MGGGAKRVGLTDGAVGRGIVFNSVYLIVLEVEGIRECDVNCSASCRSAHFDRVLLRQQNQHAQKKREAKAVAKKMVKYL
jgi:hypothetical protein